VAAIATSSNPYRPSWGTPPPVLAGRDELLDDALAALRAGPRHPLFSHAYFGDRGCGKTVLLDALAVRSRAEGWHTIELACRSGTGLVDGLVELHLPQVRRALTHRRGRRAATEVRASVGIPSVAQLSAGATWSPGPRSRGVELERLLVEVGRAAARDRTRVLITVDELHVIDRHVDLPTLAGTLQLVTQRRGLPVAFVGAGLPDVVDVLSGPDVTFLERLRKVEIGPLGADATRYALLGPAQAAGVAFALEAVEVLARASAGYPYYVQLLGWETWAAAAGAGATRLELVHARAGMRTAARVVVEQILEPRFRRLAPREQDYLRAMAVDGEDGSTTADLVARLGATRAADLSYLRERLLAKHVIRATGRGRVAFAMPGMAAWLSGGRRARRAITAERSGDG